VRRGVLFIGVMTGTCLVVLAYSDGFHPALPAVPHLIGVTLAAVLVWLVMAAAVTWLAELLRRHHKALAGHAVRHGKRGTIAAARMAGNGGRSVTSRLTSWAGPRWSARIPVRGGMDRALPQDAAERRDVIEAERRRPADSAWLRPGEKRCRACRGAGSGKDGTGTCPACRGWGSAPPDPDGPEAAPGTICTACGRAASPDDPVLADGGGPVHRSHAREQQASYDAALSGNPQQGDDADVRAEVWRLRREAEVANLRGNKAAADELGSRACDLEATLQNPSPVERARMDAWPRARAGNAWLAGEGPRPAWLDEPNNPAGAPAPDGTSPNGETTMASRINPDRRAHRAASLSGGKVPSEWGAVVATAADFEPEDDAHLLSWLSDQVQGIGAYAEGLIEAYETAINSVGLDPKGLATLHDVADAAAHCAEIMNAAKHKFTEYYELPREFAANGGLAPHDGRWVTGEGG
jgi:hypothetical protein